MEDEARSDVVVIGGGVIGAAIAYYLLRRGISTILLEKRGLLLGTSGACDGFFAVQSKRPGLLLRLALESIKEIERLSKELPIPIHYKRHGGLILIENPYEMKLMEDFVAKQREAGLEVKIISIEEAKYFCPLLSDDLEGATYSPMDGQIHPHYLTLALLEGFKASGGKIMLRSEATEVIVEGKQVRGVRTDAGLKIKTDIVVCAAGVESSRMGERLGIKIPVVPKRGQILVTEKIPPLLRAILFDAKYILVKLHPEVLRGVSDEVRRLGVGLIVEQTEHGNLLLGSTRELVGFDDNVTFEAILAIARNTLRYLPGLHKINIIRAFAGLRPSTPDGYPIIGPVEGIEGLVIATGHEGDGIALAPITGRLVSELITEGKTSIDISPLSPSRFSRT